MSIPGVHSEMTQLPQRADFHGDARLHSWMSAPWNMRGGEGGWIVISPGRSEESKRAGLWGTGTCVLGLAGGAQGEQGGCCQNHRCPRSAAGSSPHDPRSWEKGLPSRAQLAGWSPSVLPTAPCQLLRRGLARASPC